MVILKGTEIAMLIGSSRCSEESDVLHMFIYMATTGSDESFFNAFGRVPERRRLSIFAEVGKIESQCTKSSDPNICSTRTEGANDHGSGVFFLSGFTTMVTGPLCAEKDLHACSTALIPHS